MTAQPLFDTARFRDRLTSSGMPEVQARAVTESFEEALRGATATKIDVEQQGERLSWEIKQQGERLSGDISRVDANIDAVEERLEGRIAVLDESIGRRISESQTSQLRWIVASLFGGLGLLFAALKLVP